MKLRKTVDRRYRPRVEPLEDRLAFSVSSLTEFLVLPPLEGDGDLYTTCDVAICELDGALEFADTADGPGSSKAEQDLPMEEGWYEIDEGDILEYAREIDEFNISVESWELMEVVSDDSFPGDDEEYWDVHILTFAGEGELLDDYVGYDDVWVEPWEVPPELSEVTDVTDDGSLIFYSFMLSPGASEEPVAVTVTPMPAGAPPAAATDSTAEDAFRLSILGENATGTDLSPKSAGTPVEMVATSEAPMLEVAAVGQGSNSEADLSLSTSAMHTSQGDPLFTLGTLESDPLAALLRGIAA